jgi:hypothetical protein
VTWEWVNVQGKAFWMSFETGESPGQGKKGPMLGKEIRELERYSR